MIRQNVDSSNIRSIGYNREHSSLEIEFSNGDIYQYNNVPEEIYVAIMASRSKGEAVHRLLRGKYSYAKM